MRFDGHVNITLHALDILTNRSKRKDVIWPAPKAKVGDKSTSFDHWRGVLGYLISPDAGLPQLVAGVSDITAVHSHFSPNLQRLHFMRASDETELAAYQNCFTFIVNQTEAWVLGSTESIGKVVTRAAMKELLRPVPAVKKGFEVDALLAMALHCLQDSFSPGHVLRSEMDGSQSLGTAKRNASPACYESAPPIRKIFDYNHPGDQADVQAKEEHEGSDIYAGSLAYAAANAAAYASANLIEIALDSIANQRSDPTAWTRFRVRWLTHKLRLDIPRPQGTIDLDASLKRSCSPSKMACGRCP